MDTPPIFSACPPRFVETLKMLTTEPFFTTLLEPVSKLPFAATDNLGAAPSSAFAKNPLMLGRQRVQKLTLSLERTVLGSTGKGVFKNLLGPR